jgi:type III secretion protein R
MNAIENAALVALVAIVPLVVLALTSFVKLSVVLSLVRNAIGTPDAPSGLIVTALALVLTFFVMAPVAVKMVTAAATEPVPAPQGAPAPAPAPATGTAAPSIDAALRTLVPAQYQPQLAAAERAIEPLREFLAKHTRAEDKATFQRLATDVGNGARGDELWVLAPAFITTELREAFAIAILIFVPFLVIDLVVALGLASLGLQMTSPQTVALPLKLALFVAVDGWRLLLDALVRGYA